MAVVRFEGRQFWFVSQGNQRKTTIFARTLSKNMPEWGDRFISRPEVLGALIKV